MSSLVHPPELKELEAEIKRLKNEKEEAVRSQDFKRAAEIRDKEHEATDKLSTQLKEWVVKKESNKISITEDDIADIITSATNIPVRQLIKEEADKLVNLEETLHKRIAGQQEAVNAIARSIRRSRVGLKDPKRPAGSFIFLGPTGVGKTEVCKALSEILFGDENALIRVDMSEYMEKHSVSKLIGSPPGYVGYDDAGQLTEKIRKKPYAVILFDEIEKAHPDVFNILLQILEDGILTDAHGRRVDFKNTVIIMTSNVGAENSTSAKLLGFSSQDSSVQETETRKNKSLEALKATFKPEFLNRIDEIIIFNKLTNDEIKEITVRMLGEIKKRVEALGIEIEFDDKCTDLLSAEGFDPIYGARPLRRAIQRKIEDSFALEMLEDRVKKGDKITVTAEDGNIIYKPA
jgi:ATP-dependent Clp protease ATP-binding subunit ClpC